MWVWDIISPWSCPMRTETKAKLLIFGGVEVGTENAWCILKFSPDVPCTLVVLCPTSAYSSASLRQIQWGQILQLSSGTAILKNQTKADTRMRVIISVPDSSRHRMTGDKAGAMKKAMDPSCRRFWMDRAQSNGGSDHKSCLPLSTRWKLFRSRYVNVLGLSLSLSIYIYMLTGA